MVNKRVPFHQVRPSLALAWTLIFLTLFLSIWKGTVLIFTLPADRKVAASSATFILHLGLGWSLLVRQMGTPRAITLCSPYRISPETGKEKLLAVQEATQGWCSKAKLSQGPFCFHGLQRKWVREPAKMGLQIVTLPVTD